ncbi:hypothetical protein SMD11_2235 [Streptomyces albireticuli]|uniref:Uncharacterized protein n=1 Tax=Streptomyces albireticuli TaxID=1940 RepID=A0A1Z2L0U7_9ACTN|nr:hypothetical protein SMD11_2235 [Streptomyces albireticuli]
MPSCAYAYARALPPARDGARAPLSRPEERRVRWAFPMVRRSRPRRSASCSAEREASSFSTSARPRFMVSRCFFCRAASFCCASRALRALTASSSARLSSWVSRCTVAARLLAARVIWWLRSKACRGSGLSRKPRKGEKAPPTARYCSRAMRPASSRLSVRALRARVRSVPSRVVSARCSLSFSSVAL